MQTSISNQLFWPQIFKSTVFSDANLPVCLFPHIYMTCNLEAMKYLSLPLLSQMSEEKWPPFEFDLWIDLPR